MNCINSQNNVTLLFESQIWISDINKENGYQFNVLSSGTENHEI